MKQRVLTALGLGPVVLGALLLGSVWPVTILAGLVAVACGVEVFRFTSKNRQPVRDVVGGLSSVALFAALVWVSDTWHIFFPVISAVVTLTGSLAAHFGAKNSDSRLSVPACLWPAAPLATLIYLHGDTGVVWRFGTPVLLALLPLWAGDTLAIFVGRAIGKHALAPAISPNKTWEGAIANLSACLVSALFIGWAIDMSLPIATVCGLAAGTLGQAGDLFESAVKRLAGTKDSGDILPGHGGLMDRIDSMLFTAPAISLILALAPAIR